MNIYSERMVVNTIKVAPGYTIEVERSLQILKDGDIVAVQPQPLQVIKPGDNVSEFEPLVAAIASLAWATDDAVSVVAAGAAETVAAIQKHMERITETQRTLEEQLAVAQRSAVAVKKAEEELAIEQKTLNERASKLSEERAALTAEREQVRIQRSQLGKPNV